MGFRFNHRHAFDPIRDDIFPLIPLFFGKFQKTSVIYIASIKKVPEISNEMEAVDRFIKFVKIFRD
jgi:hypothetical protein